MLMYIMVLTITYKEAVEALSVRLIGISCSDVAIKLILKYKFNDNIQASSSFKEYGWKTVIMSKNIKSSLEVKINWHDGMIKKNYFEEIFADIRKFDDCWKHI